MADDPTDAAPDADPEVDDEAAESPDPAEEPDAETGTGAAGAAETKATSKATEGAGTQPATVVRKKVVSKRVTPKGGPTGKASSTPAATRSKRTEDGDDEVSFSSGRYTPPTRANAQLPSPWWVPALMFGLLIVGALVIMLNYMGVFGDAENYRLIIGLGLILAGIITATQYR